MDEKNIPAKGPQMQTQKRAAAPGEEGKLIQLIVFHLGDEEFGANIEQVREIIRIGPVTPIPDSPDFIAGVTNVRGEITVVIDLKARFALPVKEEVQERHIVITEQDKNLFGLMVDEVTEVLRVPVRDIKQTPELVTRIDRTYISGVLTLENRLIMMLDLTKVLSEEELAKLAELAERHRGAAERRKARIEKREAKVEEVKAPEPQPAPKAAAKPAKKPEAKPKRGRK